MKNVSKKETFFYFYCIGKIFEFPYTTIQDFPQPKNQILQKYYKNITIVLNIKRLY